MDEITHLSIYMKTLISLMLLYSLVTPVVNAQWIQANGPFGVQNAIFSVNGNEIFTGTPHGLIKSSDMGDNWTCVWKSTGCNNDIYALLTIDDDILISAGDGIFLSNDRGISWNEVHGIDDTDLIRSFARVDNTIFASGQTGVFVSQDNGINWMKVNDEFINDRSFETMQSHYSSLFGVNFYGVYKSGDGGLSWHQLNDQSIAGFHSICFTDDVIYYGTHDYGIFKSSDQGNTWESINEGLPYFVVEYDVLYPHVLSLQAGEHKVYASLFGVGVFETDAGDACWEPRNDGLSSLLTGALLLNQQQLFVSTNEGIYRTAASKAKWTAINKGILHSQVKSLMVNEAGVFAGTSGGGCYLSGNAGNLWQLRSSGFIADPDEVIYSLLEHGNVLFAGTNTGIYISTDNGLSWNPVCWGVEGISLASMGSIVFAGTEKGVLYSDDNGLSWFMKNEGFFSGPPIVTAMMVHDDALFLGTTNGIYITRDKGSNWTEVSNGLDTRESKYICSLNSSNSRLFAGTYQKGIFYSDDDGETWIDVDEGPQNTVYAIHRLNNNYLIAGAVGIYISTDGGLHWEEFNSGLESMTCKNGNLVRPKVFSFASDEEFLYLGTDQYGMWKRALSDIYTGSPDFPELPEYSIYPNPACSSITIIAPVGTTIQMVNSEGSVLDQFVTTGDRTELDINGREPGIYFIRFVSSRAFHVKRMVKI
jgi:photosystem II stability/assembly factor-like uncharacterized protein